jgi:hypothetical protein
MHTFQAAAYVALGEPDRAVDELCTANENRCPWLFQMLEDPRLEALRGWPKFERMRSTQAAMEVDAEKDGPGWAAEPAGGMRQVDTG